MELCQLTAQGGGPVSQQLHHVGEGLTQAVGCLVKHHGAHLAGQLLQGSAALFFTGGQKALEGEAPGVQPGHGQGGDGGAAAGNGLYRHAVFGAQGHQLLPRIADGRGTGIGDQRARFAGEQTLQNGLTRRSAVVLVVADKRLFDVKMVQQLHADAGVLRRDEVCLGQRFCGAGREVAQVADGRGHQIQDTCHWELPPVLEIDAAQLAAFAAVCLQ